MKKIILITMLAFYVVACSDKQSSSDPFVNHMIEKIAKYDGYVKNEKMITCMEQHSGELSDDEKSVILSGFDQMSPLLQSPITDEKKQEAAKILVTNPKLLEAFIVFDNKMTRPCASL